LHTTFSGWIYKKNGLTYITSQSILGQIKF
jgi:hypothetical protein